MAKKSSSKGARKKAGAKKPAQTKGRKKPSPIIRPGKR